MMKRSEMKNAYERIAPDKEAKERMLSNILSAASQPDPVRKDDTMYRRKRSPLLIAAIIALMVLLMGCAVVLFTLQDMQIGEYSYVEPRYIDENGEKVPETEKTRDVISLQGITGSPEQMAAQEWYEFEQSYDKDNKLLDEADKNPIDVPSEYDAYFVYTKEMIDKVDEIAAKYDLELAGTIAMAEEFQMNTFFHALGIGNLHQEDAQAYIEYADGYFYACGNFNAEFWLTLTGEKSNWPHEILASMRYCGKGYLDTVFAYLSDIENYEQWTYTMKDGNDVLIVMGDERVRIFYDGKAAFVSAGFGITYEDDNGVITRMTKKDVEMVADVLDFSITTQKPDMGAATKELDALLQEHLAEEEAKKETWVNPFIHDHSSYTEWAAYILENTDSPESVCYSLWDVTGDGEAELLIGSKYSFGSIKTILDGKVTTLISNGTDSGYSLCENGIIVYQNGDNYWYYQMTESDYTNIDCVEYDAWEECWYRTQNGTKVAISEEEAVAIMEGYGSIDPGMRPVTEFPMDE